MKRTNATLRRALFVIAVLGLGGILILSIAGSESYGTAAQAVEIATTPLLAYLPIVVGPAPTPTPTATLAVVPVPAWLGYVNQFRTLADLQMLTENSGWSYGGQLHSKYIVKEDYITHYEDSSSPWYTAEGYEAGRNGNVFVSSSLNTTDERAIDFWMVAPFHAVGILDPELQMTGFGSYRENDGGWQMGATLDVSRGRSGLPPGTSFPIFFPKDGGSTWLTSFYGGEWPDPLPSCPGYNTPTGAPLILQLGAGAVTPNVTDSSFRDGTTDLDHCVFDETTYTHRDSSQQQSIGRTVLGIRDAVVILPRDPLMMGHSYTASITANGSTHSWTFSAGPAPVAIQIDLEEGVQMEAR